MAIMKWIVGFMLCIAVTLPALGQSSIGLPAIKNYRNTDYHAAPEIWGIGQDKRGWLYFANNDGLLTFDGAYWKRYPVPNKAQIKSLAIDDQGRIYLGGQDEVGYFSPNVSGILEYHSLKEKLPAVARQFADIWNIVIMPEGVFFRTNESIFWWHADTMQTFDAHDGWQLLERLGSTLYSADKTLGLQLFQDGRWKSATDGVVGMLPGKGASPMLYTGVAAYATDTILVSTLKNGLFFLTGSRLIRKPTAIDALLAKELITTMTSIGNGLYAIGTGTGGILLLDRSGKVIQHYTSADGLQSNHVLSVQSDMRSNLWLGLENGISFINYTTPVKRIRPVRDNHLLCSSVGIYNGQLYLGTSNGLYHVGPGQSGSDLSTMSGSFSEVENTKGRVWSLEELDGELLMGHQDGVFVVKDDRAMPVLTKQGAWGVVETGGGRVVAGTYTGLEEFKMEGGQLKHTGKVNNLYESLQGVVADSSGRVWASHPYRGVFKNSAGSYTHYGVKEGLPGDLNNSVYVIRNRVVAATEKGVYEYVEKADRFVPSTFFQPIFHDTSVEYLRGDAEGNIWFISNQRVGVVDFSKAPYSIVYFPELTDQSVKGFGCIYPHDPENVFIGSNDGVFHLNYRRYVQAGGEPTVLLSTVKTMAEKDSLLYGGYSGGAAGSWNGSAAGSVRLPNHWNSFHFEYSSPVYSEQEGVEFSYQLEGFDKEWSDWTTKTEKDYTNLSFGHYTFKVRARDNLGNISAPVSYFFSIGPAWYQTIWAWLVYLLLVAALILAVEKVQERRLAIHKKKFEQEQERQRYLHSLELDRKEKGLIALQNAKLESELQFKNKELATATMNLVERGGILLSIKEELQAVIKRLNVSNLQYEFRSVFRMISDTEKSDEDWNRFALYFDQVHNNFLSILKTRFPLLSPTDLKLCAYLRLNLTSKEIASILNISLKGVEVSRYRLRKKLNLSTEVNLYDFLIEAVP